MVQATVLAALATLGHAAARPALAGAVFAAEDAGADCSSVVAAALQHHRESEVRASATDEGTNGERASIISALYIALTGDNWPACHTDAWGHGQGVLEQLCPLLDARNGSGGSAAACSVQVSAVLGQVGIVFTISVISRHEPDRPSC